MALTEESRFQHLLQPIRDLAGNWDINIANELEEYLASLMHGHVNNTTSESKPLCAVLQDVLEAVTFSFEEGHSLNFAEGWGAAAVWTSTCHGLRLSGDTLP